jgi:hypothetical protein
MQKDMRFMIVVFNHGRIESLTENLKKLEKFNCSEDTLVVYDCSKDADNQLTALAEFCQQNGMKLGETVQFKSRVNWGMAEGGRIDLAASLRQIPVRHKFLFQFQDHYLDTTSEHSLWPPGTKDLNGNDVSGLVKGDCIKSGHTINLNDYAEYLQNGVADVLYSSQDGIGLFPYWNDTFFCIDGVNFASKIETYLDIFDETTCAGLSNIYEPSYEWALFAEHYVGYRMMVLDLKLCDTFYGIAFRNTSDIIEAARKGANLTDLMHVSERQYAVLFSNYKEIMRGGAF